MARRARLLPLLPVLAAALLLASEAFVTKHGLTPLARVVSNAVAGVEPGLMGLGPVPAVRKALERAGLQTSDVALFELNEAFAAQVIPIAKECGIDMEKLNPHGGAIALGHPVGMSGTRVVLTLANELRRRGGGIGAAALCGGGGQGDGLIIRV